MRISSPQLQLQAAQCSHCCGVDDTCKKPCVAVALPSKRDPVIGGDLHVTPTSTDMDIRRYTAVGLESYATLHSSTPAWSALDGERLGEQSREQSRLYSNTLTSLLLLLLLLYPRNADLKPFASFSRTLPADSSQLRRWPTAVSRSPGGRQHGGLFSPGGAVPDSGGGDVLRAVDSHHGSERSCRGPWSSLERCAD